MVSKKTFLLWWIGGLIAFVIVIAMHAPLVLTQVPGGIGDHQAAATAAEVDRIQSAWSNAGLQGTAARAMLGDLVFISIYGFGCLLGGLYFRKVGAGMLRHLGLAIAISGIAFTVSDYGETTAQFLQLMANKGSDGLAGFAATMLPIKTAAWICTFVGMLAAFVIRRKQQRAG
ncbi:MAG: hypothetical protein WAT93_09810 [Pontixanthobacter sp.]